MSKATTLLPLAGTGQTITVTGTSAATTNAVGEGTNVVRIVSTTDCYVVFGPSPTATTSDMFVPGDKLDRYFSIRGGSKVAAIQASAGGTVYVHEMSD